MSRPVILTSLIPLGIPLALACSGPLATLPPSDHYTIVQSPAPSLNDEERQLVNDLNAELDRLGLPTAPVGGYECNVAAVMANVALAKLWNGSGRAFAVNSDVVAPSKTNEANKQPQHRAGSPRSTSLTDEENDAELKHLHEFQHEVSYGIPPMYAHIFTTPYAQKRIEPDDIKRWVQELGVGSRPDLAIGVAVLPVGDTDQRIWVTVAKNHSFDLVKGPPRTAEPGSSFQLAGTVFDKKVGKLSIGLLGPDGQVQRSLAEVDPDGRFEVTLTLPAATGVYTLGMHSERNDRADLVVPIFVGVDPSPWPASADPNAQPITGTRGLATLLLKTLSDYRKAHNLAPVPIDADLSAYAKNESRTLAGAFDGATGPGGSPPLLDFHDGRYERLAAAGIQHVFENNEVWSDDYVNDYFARFPSNVFLASALISPTLQTLGIGVAIVPTTISKDEDHNRYAFTILARDDQRLSADHSSAASPTPDQVIPSAAAPATAAPATAAPPSAAPAGATAPASPAPVAAPSAPPDAR